MADDLAVELETKRRLRQSNQNKKAARRTTEAILWRLQMQGSVYPSLSQVTSLDQYQLTTPFCEMGVSMETDEFMRDLFRGGPMGDMSRAASQMPRPGSSVGQGRGEQNDPQSRAMCAHQRDDSQVCGVDCIRKMLGSKPS